jgi:hypothetical protein
LCRTVVDAVIAVLRGIQRTQIIRMVMMGYDFLSLPFISFSLLFKKRSEVLFDLCVKKQNADYQDCDACPES